MEGSRLESPVAYHQVLFPNILFELTAIAAALFFLSRVHDGPLFCALAVALLGRRLLESRRVITVSSETVSYQPAVGRIMKVRFRDVESAEVKLLPSSYFLQPVFRPSFRFTMLDGTRRLMPADFPAHKEILSMILRGVNQAHKPGFQVDGSSANAV